MSTGRTLCTGLLFLLLCHGTLPSPLSALSAPSDERPSDEARPEPPEPTVPRLQREVQGELDRTLAGQQAATLTSLVETVSLPARFKTPLAVRTLTDPWTGLAALERRGLRLASLARSSRRGVPELVEAMGGGMDRAAEPTEVVPAPMEKESAIQVAYIIAVLQQAAQFREQALRKLSRAERRFLFDEAAALVEQFTPQVSESSGADERTGWQVELIRRFCDLVEQGIDQASLLAAAQVLARLADDRWLELIEKVFADQPAQPPPPGVTGDVLLVRETPAGLIVIGGRGPNGYRLDQQTVLILDLGGDDLYEGTIAAPASPERGISVVLDLAGNDTYRAAPLGLATGRLGIGLLLDRAGDDQYELAPGSGGTGFAGIGILDDREGADRYVGTTFTQGAALGGFGLLVDRAGNDRLTSFGYAIGFGGPLGLGAVLDAGGDDRYECGDRLASSSNAEEHPEAKPGDPLFQYDCFGMGAGSGFRVVRRNGEALSADGVAGGVGLLIDVAGDDRYRSANFSQGAGYFFGAGLALDLQGADEHIAARYGLASGAHGGVGLFVDYGDGDRYDSTGPFYDGGAGWDRSVALFVDAGAGDDFYDLRRSDGLGLADRHAWGIFIDERGRDRYLVPNGMGRALNNSLSGFFDLAGEDEYAQAPQSGPGRRGNRQTLVDPSGAIFQDR